MIKKKRNKFGENHSISKLTNVEVKLIRRIKDKYDWSIVKLSEKFGISKTQIGRIIHGKSWKHLQQEV